MRALLVLLLLLACALPVHAEDEPGDGRAFVETRADPARPYVGQAVSLRVRFGLDAAWFEKHAVQLFRRAMDLPIQIAVPWAAELDGVRALPPAASQAEGARFVRDDVEARARLVGEEERAGRFFRVYEWVQVIVPSRPGRVSLTAPTLRYAYATRFEDDFVGGRTPVDRRDAHVRGAPLELEVRPLPTAGRPAGYGGAVGAFQLRAEVDESSFAQAGTVRVRLFIGGRGSLHTFKAPFFPAGESFHVVGIIDGRRESERLITYEVAPLSARVSSVPSISMPYFDPREEGGYRVARTAALPLAIRASRDAQPEQPAAAPPSSGGLGEGSAPSSLMWVLLLALTAAIAWVFLRTGARGESDPGTRAEEESPTPAHDPALEQQRARERRARQLTALQRARDAGPPVAVERLIDLLASLLDVSPAAIVAPDLEERLRVAGVDAGLAARVSIVIEQDVAARYSGSSGQVSLEAGLVDEIYVALVGEVE